MFYMEALKFKKDTPYRFVGVFSKLYFLVLYSLTSLIFDDLRSQLFLLILLIALFLIGKLFREVYRFIRGSALFFVMIVLFDYIFSRDLVFSLSMGVRLLNLSGAFALFFSTVLPSELSDLMVFLKLPYTVAFIFTASIRFIPVLVDDVRNIVDAQKSRGLELEKGGIMERVKKYIPILVPLIVHSIRRSQQLAEALESRAFGSSKKRTSLYSPSFSVYDIVFIVGVTLVLLILYQL